MMNNITLYLCSLHGLGCVACSHSESTSEAINASRHLVGLLRRGIGLSQGLYLQRTTQHRKVRTYIRAASGIRTYDSIVQTIQEHLRLRQRRH